MKHVNHFNAEFPKKPQEENSNTPVCFAHSALDHQPERLLSLKRRVLALEKSCLLPIKNDP